MSVVFLIAWITPFALGSGIVALLSGRPRSASEYAYTLGCGFVLGAACCALAIVPLGRIAVAHIVPILAPILLTLALAAWWSVLRRPLRVAPQSDQGKLRPWAWALLVLLALHAWIMLDEILLRPMYPWDAWAAWLLKPKAWMLGGYLDRFVSFDKWLRDGGGLVRTAQTWNYPETLGRLAIWFTSAWGEWDAGVVGAIWFVLWLALLCGSYGQLRALDLSRERALIAIYALGSLPLINVHVALAGYADIWIATLLAFACLSWLRGLQSGARGHYVLAVLFAAALPLIKLEGAIWVVILGGTMLYARMPPRLRRLALGLAPIVGAGILVGYLLRWPLIAPALDRIGLSADTGVLLKHAPGVIVAAASGLFAQYNWHLFWFAAALTLIVRFAHLRSAPALRVFGLFLLLACAFLFALFVLTPAGQWAESYTAVNRLSLQIVPAMLVFTALLWRDTSASRVDVDASSRVAEAVPVAP